MSALEACPPGGVSAWRHVRLEACPPGGLSAGEMTANQACPNCNGPLTSNHQCDSESDSDDEDYDDEEEQVAPKGKILDAVQHLQEGEAMYKMLLQINASNPFMKKNSD